VCRLSSSSVVVVHRRRPSSSSIVAVHRHHPHLYLLSSHVSTLAHRIGNFYCMNATLQDEATGDMTTGRTMVTGGMMTASGRTATGNTTTARVSRATGSTMARHDDGNVRQDNDDGRHYDGKGQQGRRGRRAAQHTGEHSNGRHNDGKGQNSNR
jgi:hypothetical protein